MVAQLLQALSLSPLCLLLVGGAIANAQNLPPYAGTYCTDFATYPEAQWHYMRVPTAPISPPIQKLSGTILSGLHPLL
ncbi:MAG: hypothetical protein KME14_05275 [Tildeniella torsiva UHER 1998/13D]|jgi:hypothetical protein|nr:hypothetical protein [Tildeniella torsiva UHER 1998/13D]